MKIQSILLAVISFSSFSSFSQMRPGIEVGANYSNIIYSDNNGGETSSLLGLHARGIVEFVMSDLISIETGLGYSAKGNQGTFESSFSLFGSSYNFKNESRIRLNYLNVPILVKAGINLGEGRMYLGVGPDVYFAASGNVKSESTTTINGVSEVEKDNSNIDFKEDNISRFDLGAKGVIGYEKNGIFVQAGFEKGFINLNTDPQVDQTMLNQNFLLTIGFKLGGY